MSTSESASPKSRGRHRAHKSGANIPSSIASYPKNAHSDAQQFHKTNSDTMPRQTRDNVTPPESPQAHHQATNGKKKRKPKPRPREVNTDFHPTSFQGYDSHTNSSSNEESTGGPSSPSQFLMTTPTKAYAGPNFHSSPAPSTLPVPKWFSKSLPATPNATTSLHAMLDIDEGDKITTLSHSLEDQESPLQRLFRADKEEKARRGQNSPPKSLPPALATLAHTPPPESPTQVRRLSPDGLEVQFSELFTMELEQKSKTAQQNILGRNLFPTLPVNSRASEAVARQKADALRSFLSEPKPLIKPRAGDDSTQQGKPTSGPATPVKRQSAVQPKQGSTTLRTPPAPRTSQPKRRNPPKTAPIPERQPHFILSPPKAPKGPYASAKTTAPKRDYKPFASSASVTRGDLSTDSVLQVSEMEEYLRRILRLERNAIAAPAVAS